MKSYCWVLLALAFLGTGCRKSQQAPQLLRPAYIKDIMHSMVDPSGEFVFQSVQQISDEHGIHEKAPQTDADWEDVRERLIVLLEAPNLLVMPGRKVAPPNATVPESPELNLSQRKFRRQ